MKGVRPDINGPQIQKMNVIDNRQHLIQSIKIRDELELQQQKLEREKMPLNNDLLKVNQNPGFSITIIKSNQKIESKALS